MPAKRKRRNPSQREPIGKTKSQILLYIVNNQNCTMTDIRRYSKDNLNIRNKKGILKHVSELLSAKLIKKVKNMKGVSDQYYIGGTFSEFGNCFNYLHENSFSVEFLKTDFAHNVLLNDNFFFYGLVNAARKLFIEFLDVMSDENKFNEILLEDPKGVTNEGIALMKEQRAKMLRSDILEFVSRIRDKSVEELVEYGSEVVKSTKQVLMELTNKMFSQEQKEEIINILSTSPSAMDFFLNLNTENRMVFLAYIMHFFIGIIFVDSSKVEIINYFNNLAKEPDMDQFLSLITDIFSSKNVTNQNPILTILKAHFLIDAFNGKIIENKYSTKALKSILIPEVK